MQFELSWKDLSKEYRRETEEVPRVRVHMVKQNREDPSRNRSRNSEIRWQEKHASVFQSITKIGAALMGGQQSM